MRGRAHFSSYKAPGIDSHRAIANATLFLTGARSIDGLTPERVAFTHHLKPKTAEYLLTKERQRRAANAL